MNKLEQDNQKSGFRFVQPDKNVWKLDGNIHVWKFPVLATEFTFLNPEEKLLADRFRFDGDRNRYAIGREALRILVSKYLSVKPMDLVIHSENGRKPFIGNPVTDIRFNISHSGDWVLIALAQRDLGIDVEKINQEFDFVNLLEDHFGEEEKTFISNAADSVSAFYYLWTRKEALIKAWGTGMQDNLKQISVLPTDPSINYQQRSWAIESFQLSAQYPAALAYPGHVKKLWYFDGSSVF